MSSLLTSSLLTYETLQVSSSDEVLRFISVKVQTPNTHTQFCCCLAFLLVAAETSSSPSPKIHLYIYTYYIFQLAGRKMFSDLLPINPQPKDFQRQGFVSNVVTHQSSLTLLSPLLFVSFVCGTDSHLCFLFFLFSFISFLTGGSPLPLGQGGCNRESGVVSLPLSGFSCCWVFLSAIVCASGVWRKPKTVWLWTLRFQTLLN